VRVWSALRRRGPLFLAERFIGYTRGQAVVDIVVGDTPLARREPLSRSARDGQTVWVKGGRDDQGFPLSVSVTVSVTV
jgi:hypothetical protein